MSVRHNRKIALACARAKIGRDHKAALEIMRYLPEAAFEELSASTLGQIADGMHKMLQDARARRTIYL